MKIGSLTLERTTETRNAGPLDVVTTTWSGKMGKTHWSRSRPTRITDARSGKTQRVGTARRAAVPGAVAAAVASSAVGLLARRVHRRNKT